MSDVPYSTRMLEFSRLFVNRLADGLSAVLRQPLPVNPRQLRKRPVFLRDRRIRHRPGNANLRVVPHHPQLRLRVMTTSMPWVVWYDITSKSAAAFVAE